MPGLTATGELSYNGYLFDGATNIKVEVEFLYDDAKRTVIAHRHEIKVNATVAENDGLDSDLLDIRQRLGEPGKKLTFENKGFGNDLKLTPTGIRRDVMDGPRPRVLTWQSLGDDKAALITWIVEVTVAVCAKNKQARSAGTMAINYGIDYAIDNNGDTRRTIFGYIQLAQSVIKGRPATSADKARRQFAPAGVHGFKREQNWSLSLDKSRLDFTITDTQIPSANPYPPGIIEIQATHRQSWSRGRGKNHFSTITATITPEARLGGAQAWQVFLEIVSQRMAISKREKGRSIFLEALSADENIFGRSHSFSATYRFISSLKDFIGDAGLWRAIGTNWQTWGTSLKQSMFHPRGNARLRDLPNNDVIVSLCESEGLAFVSPNNRQEFQTLFTPVGASSPGIRNERPSPGESWVEYDLRPMIVRQEPVIRQAILQDQEDDAHQWLLEDSQVTVKKATTSFDFPKTADTIPDVIQSGGKGRYRFRLLGHAKRLGYEIPRATVKTIGDQPAIEVGAAYTQRVEGNYFGVPMFEAAWAVDYILPQAPGSVRSLSDPEKEVDTATKSAAQPSPGTIP